MLSRYRGVLIAVAGLILVGSSKAPEPQAKARQQQSQAKGAKTAPDAPVRPAKASEQVQASKDSQPCGNGRYRSDDDLCAQWKAADAARDAANWAWWQLGLSALGVLGLGITLWFNFRALTRAGEANTIAKEIGQHQVRCYLSISKATFLNSTLEGGTDGGLFCEIKNSGQSLARNVRLEADFTYFNTSKKTLRTQSFVPETVAFEFIAASGAEIQMRPILGPYALTKDEIAAVNAGETVCVEVNIRIFAKDVFGLDCPANEFFIHHFSDKDHLFGKYEMDRMGSPKHL